MALADKTRNDRSIGQIHLCQAEWCGDAAQEGADLVRRQAPYFELVVNKKTAYALGLALPPSLLAQASETID